MKKGLRIISVTACLLTLLLVCSACGTMYAEVTGLEAGITGLDETDFYLSPLSDNSTLNENDYVLRAGEPYRLVVELTYSGGSRQPGFASADGITLRYDRDLLQIGEPSTESGRLTYPLECRRDFTCGEILVESSEGFHAEVIISAVN